VAVEDGQVKTETINFNNETNGLTQHPEPISKLFSIETDSEYQQFDTTINSVTINFNNGFEPIDVNVKETMEDGKITYSVDGNYYYDHKDKIVTETQPPSGHNFDIYKDEVPMPLDYANNLAYISIDMDLDSYTTTNYQIDIEVASEYPIRDDENALFNIEVREGDFQTDNMKHVTQLNKYNILHISELTNEFLERAKNK
jgi:hypothetical protein